MFVEQKKMIILVLVLVVVLVLAGVGYRLLAPQAGLSGTLGGTQSASGSGASPAAQPAPDFTVYDADGNKVTLASLMESGKPAVLNFWASTCPPCKAEMADFQTAYEAYGDQIHFVMVNMTDGRQETVETASAFIRQKGYGFPVFYDTSLDAAMTYGAYSLPTTFFIDAQGDIVAQAVGAIDGATLQKGIDMIAAPA